MIDESARTIRRVWPRIPAANTSALLSAVAVAVTRTFASMYCTDSQTDGDTRLMPGVPAASLHYVAGVAPVGVPAFAAAMVRGALVRTAPYAVLGQGIGWGRSPRS